MPALFVEQLTVIDFSYLHPQRGLLGESWIVDLELGGELDEQGMVFDFGPVKKSIKTAIDAVADHKLLVPTQLPGLNHSCIGEQLDIEWDNADFPFRHSSPSHAVLLLDCSEISAEFLAEELVAAVQQVVPSNVSEIKLRLYPESIDGAFYHYSHGLKKHLGDCQRIAHGHRSKIRVINNGSRDPHLESQLSALFQDVYLATTEDLRGQPVIAGVQCTQFAYQSQQGVFSITLPKDRCVLLSTDTTVELIADNFLKIVLQTHSAGGQVQVKAYEGVGKGALARS